MNKKFLSAILFGALMVTSTGTFVSCKDYDDDIDRIDKELSDLKSQLSALQTTVNAGKYVTGVAKTSDGKGITFTFNQGDPVTVTLDVKDGSAGTPGKDGSLITFDGKTGEMLVDNNPTGIFPTKDAEKAPVKMEGGYWYSLNDKGEYTNTNIPVSGLTVVGSEAEGWTLTAVDADGKTQTVKVPSAASLITSIVLRSDKNPQPFVISKATFAKPSKWDGKRELPADKSVIYSSSTIDIRVNPVDAPATEVKYYLTNTKNQTLSKIVLAAEAESSDNAITIDGIAGRAANTGNGLFTLGMDQYILSKSDAEAFDKELTEVAKAATYSTVPSTSYSGCVAYAINANNKARSAYNVAIATTSSANLSSVLVKEIGATNSTATLAANNTDGNAKPITVAVGKSYTIDEISGESGLMYDMFFYVSEVNKKTYGVDYDDLKHTFTVTKNPDISTPANGFYLTVNTLDTKGNVGKVVYKVTLDASIETPATYTAITYDVAQLKDNNANNDAFTLDMDIMKNALADKWVQWANTVDLSKTAYAIYEKADCSDAGTTVGSTSNGLDISLTASDKSTAATVNNLKYTVVKVDAKNADGLKLDKQYYLKITFKNSTSTDINSIVVPVTFTAPDVASQFALKSGYVVEGTINAYFYDIQKKNVALNRYFDKYDANATIALDAKKEVKTKDNKSYRSSGLAELSANKIMTTTTLTLNTSATDKDGGNAVNADTNTGKEFGYGETLTITATNNNYTDTQWAYTIDSKKAYSFTIKVMSPIMEGKIVPAQGTTIEISANATDGFDITKSMIVGYDYNDNVYNVVPDANGTSATDLKWSNEQIKQVSVTKDANNTYINAITVKGQYKNGNNTIAGAFNVKADPLPNTTETSINVIVEDAWNYKASKPVSITIKKN